MISLSPPTICNSALATAKILPWPWGESSYRSALADIGSAKGNPWVQDINHRVTL
ncbi:DUF6710 family protein [Klebsiella pneumoniae]|uniref:DUF6710 family protein n=1 Tax=Klebsiella pneumoniae TaxID=573 RepID=UPI002B3FFC88|nr:DUF6710 family protein [Klebsiella pneumoniae]